MWTNGCMDNWSTMQCGVDKACSHRDCNEKEICQKSTNCKWDHVDRMGKIWGCMDDRNKRKCGFDKPCGHRDCQNKDMCQKRTNCKWDMWTNGCMDKVSTECGLSRQCNHYDCQDENVCKKTTNCEWDRWEGCKAIEPDLQCIEEKDMAYDDPGRGGGFYILYKETKEECACACKDEEKCNFFTWNKKDKQCQMITTIVKRKHRFGSYSGNVNCCIRSSVWG